GVVEAGRIDDDAALAVGQTVPFAQFHLLRWPSAGAVHADDERRRLRAVVAARNIEQVLPRLARGDDRSIVPIANVEGDCLEQREHCRQSDEHQNNALHRWRFQATASGAAASRVSGTSRIATSARTYLPISCIGTIHMSNP